MHLSEKIKKWLLLIIRITVSILMIYRSGWLALPQHTSVSISLAFYLINAAVSLAGIWYFLNGRFGLKTTVQQ